MQPLVKRSETVTGNFRLDNAVARTLVPVSGADGVIVSAAREFGAAWSTVVLSVKRVSGIGNVSRDFTTTRTIPAGGGQVSLTPDDLAGVDWIEVAYSSGAAETAGTTATIRVSTNVMQDGHVSFVAAAAAAPGAASATTVEVDLGSTPKTSGRFTIVNGSISASSKVLVWQAAGPYTGKGTLADEAAMQPVNIVAVQSGSGSCTVWWETPPIIVTTPVVPDGSRDSPSTVAGFDPRYPNVEREMRRIGEVRGNVKFSYMILS